MACFYFSGLSLIVHSVHSSFPDIISSSSLYVFVLEGTYALCVIHWYRTNDEQSQETI